MKNIEFYFDLKQIRSYLEILRVKSFTQASRNLKIGQATISNQIQNLEKMLGVSLIRRNSKEFSVTREGEIFRDFCERLFLDIEQLKSELGRKFKGGITPIVASTIPSSYILPDIIASIKKEKPDYIYRVDVTDSREVVEKIKEGNAEIGLTGKQYKHPSLIYEHFLSDEIVLVGGMEYPDQIGVHELRETPLIARESGSGTRNACEEELRKHKILPSDLNIVFESYTSDGVKEAAISGIGAAFISNLAIKRELRLKFLKIIEIRDMRIERDFYFLHQKNRQLSRPAEYLINSLRNIKNRDTER